MPDALTATGRLVRFGRFEMDLQSLELRKGGGRVRIQEQPLTLLLLMLDRPGEVLTREELRVRLWPDGTFVDFEHGLNAAVKRLRNVLGDTADNPRYVETVPRRGYRFIVSVERLGQRERDTGRDVAVNATALLGGRTSDAAETRVRLAVLPFANLGDPSQDYFSDGLTGEMIAQVGRLCARRVGVIARGSAAAAGRSRTIAEIRDALRVDYVLEGTVRRDNGRVRITAQLIETHGETQVWADAYDRQLSDYLAVQADVALHIARALVGELSAERPSLGGASRDPLAYQAYLKGLFHWNKPADEGVPRAIDYFEQAIAIDPTFSSAHAALARARLAEADYYTSEPRSALEGARAAARAALALDGQDGVAQVALAAVHQALDWDLGTAERLYQAAMTANPSNEAAYRRYALLLAARRRKVEAVAAIQRACELDPVCLVVNTCAALVHYFARDYGRALDWCRHTLEMEPYHQPVRRMLAAVLVQRGRPDEAVKELTTGSLRRSDPVSLTWLAHALAVSGRQQSARRLVDRVTASRGHFASSYHLAIVYAGLRDRDAVFALLDRACDERDPALYTLAVEPRFDGVRSDPRYDVLVGRLGLAAREEAPAATLQWKGNREGGPEWPDGI